MSVPWIAAFVALWVVVILLGFLVLGTLRRLAPLIERTEASLSEAAQIVPATGLPRGAMVPAFAAEELGGARFTHSELRGSRKVLLFLGSSCQACERFVHDLRQGSVPDLGARLVVVADDAGEARRFPAANGVTVLVQEDHSLTRLFESDRVPHAFIVEDGRVLANGWPNDWEGLRNLLIEAQEGGDRESDVAAAAVAS